MATRSEQAHAEEQRKGPRGWIRAGRSKPGVPREDRSPDRKHAGKKATYALEPEREGRPSRKSTRKSANRSKADSRLNIREQIQKTSPDARARKARAANQ
jgi:hypothetical protein